MLKIILDTIKFTTSLTFKMVLCMSQIVAYMIQIFIVQEENNFLLINKFLRIF